MRLQPPSLVHPTAWISCSHPPRPRSRVVIVENQGIAIIPPQQLHNLIDFPAKSFDFSILELRQPNKDGQGCH
ncbi:uncharacterized protein BDZ99DRAFT_54409 [Mytilinidion resinicola]|uniref:Uncharacterized protein n=1 Tax=Mytilinidion resinicola TaxID=574789 RepID=A0A6A6YHR6_9PEZI|nr:uncharacterized protein BDZ99DRAFT_54409 [Mytilinidion resinicola]KAF2808372.1 hypothetical protein BDZ99DRAFT_54409 [Mytilinidion resinicola]